MLRLVIVAFFGRPRTEAAAHAHEAPVAMTWPLIALAVPSVAVAWFGLGDYLSAHFNPHFHAHEGGGLFGPFNHAPLAAMFGTCALLFGVTAAFGTYWGVTTDPLPARLGLLSRAMRNRFYFDEIYEAIFVPMHDMVGRLAAAVDRWVVSGLCIRGIHGSVELAGRALRLLQTGNLQTYTFLFAAGVAVVVFVATK
jgi:NADH-quinone oxidoreductase subunit L